MILSFRSVALVSVLGVVAACGDGSDTASPPEAPTIVATTSIWADITSNVACGAPVGSIIPAGADSHSYEPSLRDREALSAASVVVANGAGLEETIEDLLDAAIEDGVNVVEVASHIDLLEGGHGHDEHADDEHSDDEHADDEHADDEHSDDEHSDDEHADDEHSDDEHSDDEHSDDEHSDETASDDEHSDETASDEEHADEEHADAHGDGDPHVWQDPTRVAGALDVIASALAAEGVDTCEEQYRDELLALDREIDETLSPVPAEARLLVTSHDSLAYFADRYDFEVVGTVIPSTSTMADSSAGELAALTQLIEERSVQAMFTDAFESASDAEALAGRIGIPVVPLVTDALTDDAPTYAGMMRANAASIATALAP